MVSFYALEGFRFTQQAEEVESFGGRQSASSGTVWGNEWNSPPPPSSVVSPPFTHSPWTKSQQQLWSAIVYLTIIPQVRVGYEIIDSYTHLISNKRVFKLLFH